ncbi:pterin-4-alpha-carbinolamine dehydratase 2, mitochondrial-like [Silene latifolia]|uniref:pterin-4-alpha-carbinolamine dehydratase 2, mitochondrial-like n=1 Tax=Silene latifolia TaxID=37657 RepID=UPI003D777453
MSRILAPLRLLHLSKSQAQFSPLFHLCIDHGCSSTRVNGLLQNHMQMSKSRKIHNEHRNFSTATELASKKCVPCNTKDLRPMSEELANKLITKVPEWKLVNEGEKLKLSRSWKVKTFVKGLEFLQAIADVAETEGHHPDLHLVGWNNVTIEIWTHSVGGLTENDFILAAKIDNLDLAHLLRIKPAK